MNGEALLDELCRTVGRFVVLPKHAAEAVALWVLHAYAFELRDITTYLGIESPEKRCGKTTDTLADRCIAIRMHVVTEPRPLARGWGEAHAKDAKDAKGPTIAMRGRTGQECGTWYIAPRY